MAEPSTDAFHGAMRDVAHELLGEPNAALSSAAELRYGSHGSMSVDLAKGVWRDHEADEGGGVLALVMREQRVDRGRAVQWLESRGYIPERAKPINGRRDEPPPPSAKIVATYDYRDADGELLFQVCRMDGGRARFLQRRRGEDGRWSWKVRGVKKAPYRLPELQEHLGAERLIVIAEGEKDVDRLWLEGIPATCNAGGAGKWTDDLNEHFRGAHIVIVPDNDEAGRKHRDVVGAELSKVAASVRVLDLPDLPEKGDVSDWFDAGGDSDLFARMLDTRTRPWTPGPPASRFGGILWSDLDRAGEDYEWLAKGVLPRCGLGLLYGASQSGKSFLAIDLAMSVARGIPWLGRFTTRPGAVAYQAGEGGRGVRKRLVAYRQRFKVDARANIPFVLLPGDYNMWADEKPGEDGEPANGSTDAMIEEIRAWSKHLGQPIELFVIDTLAAASVGADENASRDMGRILASAKRIQETCQCAVLVVHHKNAGGERPRGHTSLYAAADAALEVTADPETRARTLRMAKVKDDEDGAKIAFRLGVETIGRDEEDKAITSCIIVSDGEMAAQAKAEPQAGKRLPDRAAIALDALRAEMSITGRAPPVGVDIPSSKTVVTLLAWRNRFTRVAHAPEDSQDTIRKSFDRQVEALQARHLVDRSGTLVWLTTLGLMHRG